ncbi:GDSL-type esterase/lipase family protein [Gorillibacterium sp. CAU 1737]|uniref:SGNH/GDSL hydrolase family protein n=1 Tax=Gorillibacterium sp. CAU 1737 TaxID=3140362 RepID=UPI0032611BE1
MQAFQATKEYVKPIGRTHDLDGTRWLALSGSGIEFSFTGKKAELTIKGDQIATGSTNQARIGIYVNGERVVDDQLTEPLKTYTAFESDTVQDVTVTVVKLSEAAMSTVGIQEIRVDAKGEIQPTAAKARKIEIIGDSITCGYGVDDESENNSFSTATEDVTKGYAYLTAQALGTDVNIVSYSGYGIISGYTTSDEKLTTQLVPPYYEKVAYSVGKFDGTIKPETLDWDFQAYTPDLVVINLGTNDDSYTQEVGERQAEYAREYVEFLKQVRARNPQAMILCTLGIMGDRLFPFVEQAVANYSEQTGDTRISSMKFDVQLASDGYGADWHPSKITQVKAAEKLTAAIKELMNW